MTGDHAETTMRWAVEIEAAPAITRVALAAATATSLIITLAIETRVALVANREPHLLTITIKVALEATLTHIRGETITFLAQITTEGGITTTAGMVAKDHLTEVIVAVPLTVALAEVAPLITEATNLDLMIDAGMTDLDMIDTINHLQETITTS